MRYNVALLPPEIEPYCIYFQWGMGIQYQACSGEKKTRYMLKAKSAIRYGVCGLWITS